MSQKQLFLSILMGGNMSNILSAKSAPFVMRHFKLEKERMDLVNWIGQQVTNWPL